MTEHRRARYLIAAACSITVACTSFASVKPIETTMAFKLLKIEASVRSIPRDAEAQLRDVIAGATKAAVDVNPKPLSKADAIVALEAIQLVLVRSNFLQPLKDKDWPNTMGIALTPRKFSSAELDAILAGPDNEKRRLYLNSQKPIYFVDCDMGSQIFIAVGERLGWDMRLVEVPKHNFIRWHLADGTTINWDWTHGESLPDSYYSWGTATDNVRLRQLYLRSLGEPESYAYFLALIATEAGKVKAADTEQLFQKAIADLPHHPLVLNNFAWYYATNTQFQQKSGLAIAYSLAAWSMRPLDGNYADTVACSFAMAGQKELAKETEQFAIAHADSLEQRDGFAKNKKRIDDGQPCQ